MLITIAWNHTRLNNKSIKMTRLRVIASLKQIKSNINVRHYDVPALKL